jgi:hypothetical protein
MTLGHAGVQAAGAAVTARLDDTGADIGGAWFGYEHYEATSANELRMPAQRAV